MAVTGLNQIHVSVDDLDIAITFYRDVLGLRLLFEVPGQSMAFFDLDGIRLYIGKPEDPDLVSAPLLYFSVDAIEAEHQRLLQDNVEFVAPPHQVHESAGVQLWMAFFRTPWGHLNALVEERGIDP
jgi:catechol 2,3-dioxygenase-like lactoylglutathione lyase family enzyme